MLHAHCGRRNGPDEIFGRHNCFFAIGHDRRKILHFHVTRNPRALWVVQQLREAWAYKQPHRFLLFDRDTMFGADVVSAVKDMGSQPIRTAFRCPWQNGVAERWVGSCRRDLLDHVIILNERHLKRLLSSYLLYYNYASYYPPRYLVENSKPFCCGVGIVVCRLLRRTRSTNLAVASVSSAR